jgi:hypothetical protein
MMNMMQSNADRALKSHQHQAQQALFRKGQRLQGKVRTAMHKQKQEGTPNLPELMLYYGLVTEYVAIRNDVRHLLHMDRLTQEMSGLQSQLRSQLVALGIDERFLKSIQQI